MDNGVEEKKEDGDWIVAANASEIGQADGSRIHTKVSDRYISIVRWRGQLHAIDSICFHGGGPLGSSEIEDLPDVGGCLVCPWHFYRVALDNGDKIYQSANMVNGKLEPGDWKRIGKRQRVHQIQVSGDKILIKVDTEGECASDKYAKSEDCAMLLVHKSARNVDSARSMLPKRFGSFFQR